MIGFSDNSENSASLQCLADDVEMSSITLLLSMSPVNITSTSLSAVHFPDDICLQLCVPRAREKTDSISIPVSALDFARSALVDVACSLMSDSPIV